MNKPPVNKEKDFPFLLKPKQEDEEIREGIKILNPGNNSIHLPIRMGKDGCGY